MNLLLASPLLIILYRRFLLGPLGLSCKVFDSLSGSPGFKPRWILMVLRGWLFGQDNSEPQPCTSETQERRMPVVG